MDIFQPFESDVQSHIAYHLERIAAEAYPPICLQHSRESVYFLEAEAGRMPPPGDIAPLVEAGTNTIMRRPQMFFLSQMPDQQAH